MATGIDGKLQTSTLSVEDLVESVRDGRVRIPSFQRGIRWTFSDVRANSSPCALYQVSRALRSKIVGNGTWVGGASAWWGTNS